MGLLDQLGGMMNSGGSGGGDVQQLLGRFMGGSANVHDPNHDDHRQFQHMMGQSSDEDLSHAFSHAARNVDGREYQQHVTPGAGGTDPLGSVGGGGLATLASALMSNLGGVSGRGSAGGGGM